MFSQTLSPRFYETDALGHINNMSIAGWLEVSRTGFIASLARSGGASVDAEDWALASVQIDYLEETFFGTDVDLKVTAATIGNTSLTLTSEVWQAGRRTVSAKATLVHFDVAKKAKKRIPDSLRELIDAAAAQSSA